MVHGRPVGIGPVGGHAEDGGHHQVHRDDVDDAFGHAGKLAQQPAGVGDDDGLGHAEAADPAGTGLFECGLNDGRAHDGDGQRAGPLLHQDALAHGLGEGVGVGPAQRMGPGRAGIDQLGAYPLLADLLGPGGQEVIARPADLVAGLLGEAGEAVGSAGGRLEVVTQATGGLHLVLPIDVEREPVLREQFLLGLPLMRARHIRGGHGDQVGARAGGGQGGADPGRAEQVDLDGLGQWAVEGDRGGGVDDDVAGGQGGPPGVVQPQAVLTHVAGDGLDPSGHLGGELVAELLPQAVEAVVPDDLTGQSGGGIRPPAGPNQYGDLGVRDAAQDAFDQRSAQKSGRTGNEEALCTEVPADRHRNCLPSTAESVYHLVSEHRGTG